LGVSFKPIGEGILSAVLQNVPQVYSAIAEVMAKLAKVGIGKNNKNTQQGYKFRGIDDVYNALAPFLAESKLLILPRVKSRIVTERETKSGGVLFYVVLDVEFDFVSAIDGSKHTVQVVGEAMDSGDKASNKAMSAAYKYACMEAFCIPTEGDNDADATTHEVTPKPGVHSASDGLGNGVDLRKVGEYCKRFIAAMDLDKEEPEIAAAVYAIHEEVMSDHDLYTAIGNNLTSRAKGALRKYVDLHRKGKVMQ
jgi:hypothetical protein